MNTRIISIAFGITFFLVGIVGFINNPIISSQGFFEVNEIHNAVHIILGIAFILGTLKYSGNEGRVLKLLGLGGIVVSILGFITGGDKLLGVIHTNQADHWLHLGLAIVVLASGFIFKTDHTQEYPFNDT